MHEEVLRLTRNKDMTGWPFPLEKFSTGTPTGKTIRDDDAWLSNFPRRYRKVIRDTPSPAPQELTTPSNSHKNATLQGSAQVEIADIRQQISPHQQQRSYQRKRENAAFTYGQHHGLLHKDVSDTFFRAQLAYNGAPITHHIQPEVIEQISDKAVSVHGLEYDVIIDGDKVHIGCLCRTIEQWGNLSQSDIASIDGKRALDFWHKYRHILSEMAQLQKQSD